MITLENNPGAYSKKIFPETIPEGYSRRTLPAFSPENLENFPRLFSLVDIPGGCLCINESCINFFLDHTKTL